MANFLMQPSPIAQLSAMIQRASDESQAAAREARTVTEGAAGIWLRQVEVERLTLEMDLRSAMLSITPTSLGDALILATALFSHAPEKDDDVSLPAREWAPIVTALENIVVALADAVGEDGLTPDERSVVGLVRKRQGWRGLG